MIVFRIFSFFIAFELFGMVWSAALLGAQSLARQTDRPSGLRAAAWSILGVRPVIGRQAVVVWRGHPPTDAGDARRDAPPSQAIYHN